MQTVFLDEANIVLGSVVYSTDGSAFFSKPYAQQINVPMIGSVPLGGTAVEQTNGTWIISAPAPAPTE